MWHILKFLSLSTDTLYINVINFFAAHATGGLRQSCCHRHALRKRKYYNLILLEYVLKMV